MAVVTTAALGAGVDFPASQVIFDALAMGRDWLSVQEFNQMGGRAGRPDFHDLGRVVILAEPGGSYSRENPGTEEEIAIRLLKGEMEEVAPEHEFEASSEEYVANAIACNGEEADLNRINSMMVGSMEPVLPDLIAHRLVEKQGTRLVMTPLARVMAEHFIGMERLLEIIRLTKCNGSSRSISSGSWRARMCTRTTGRRRRGGRRDRGSGCGSRRSRGISSHRERRRMWGITTGIPLKKEQLGS